MTMQVKDRVILRSKEYSLLGKSGGSLFDLEMYEITPGWSTSANWRGFSCVFAVREESLLLDNVNVNATQEVSRTKNFLPLFGIYPTLSLLKDRIKDASTSILDSFSEDEFPILLYRNIAAKISYTGSLLIAEDWVDSDVFMDRFQHTACRYANVRELLLLDGQVTQEYNRSSEMAAVREKMLAMEMGEQFENRAQIREQIERCFLQDQEYDYRY